MTSLTAIALEVYIGSSWIDLWPDVLHDVPVHGSRGMQNNESEDLVADPGVLTFSLNNASDNSAGKAGYYSPGHANCLSGWTTSLPVRLRLDYDTWQKYKWYGRILPNGIKVAPGTNASRRVHVSCQDFIGLAAQHQIDLMNYQTDLYAWRAVEAVLANMPSSIWPLEKNYYDEATYSYEVLPVAFDIASPNTKALGEFQKIATSQRLPIYTVSGSTGERLQTGDNPPVGDSFKLPLTRASSGKCLKEDGGGLLQEDGSYLLLDQLASTAITFDDGDILESSEFGFGAHIHNFLTVTTYPRKSDTDATTVLWTLEAATQIAAGTTLVLRAAYRDPNGGPTKVNCINGTTPVRNTDFKGYQNENGTGADLSTSLTMAAEFGSAEAKITLTNTGGTALYTGGTAIICQLRGQGLYIYDPVRTTYQDQASIDTHGKQPYTIELKYQEIPTPSKPSLASFGDSWINIYKDPSASCESLHLFASRDDLNLRAFLFLEPRSQIVVSEAQTATSLTTYVQGYEFDITSKDSIFWKLILKNN